MQVITSQANPQIKQIIALRKKPRERAAQGVFLAEGSKMCLEAPAEAVEQVLISESFLASETYRAHAARFAALSGRTLRVSDRVFAAVSDTQTPQGVLCLVRQPRYRLEDLYGAKKKRAPLLMILENVQDPGNLGTMIRTGEGAGVTGFFLSPGCVDIYNPKVIRSTMGSIYRVPFLYAADSADFYAALRRWRAGGEAPEAKGPGQTGRLRLFAAHLRGKRAYDREDYTGPAAFMIGNESRGLSDEAADLADTLVRIPMLGQVESLNAAMAGGLLLYEAARQRRAAE